MQPGIASTRQGVPQARPGRQASGNAGTRTRLYLRYSFVSRSTQPLVGFMVACDGASASVAVLRPMRVRSKNKLPSLRNYSFWVP